MKISVSLATQLCHMMSFWKLSCEQTCDVYHNRKQTRIELVPEVGYCCEWPGHVRERNEERCRGFGLEKLLSAPSLLIGCCGRLEGESIADDEGHNYRGNQGLSV